GRCYKSRPPICFPN
nr:Chain C, Trypsin inhibitor 1 [Helianthus annuus]